MVGPEHDVRTAELRGTARDGHSGEVVENRFAKDGASHPTTGSSRLYAVL
jgi:hypothetical protein